jgi:hypothetical protein
MKMVAHQAISTNAEASLCCVGFETIQISAAVGIREELSPEETDDLHRHLQQICEKAEAIEKWAKVHNLIAVIRDHAGVLIEPPHHSEGDNADIRRPTSDAEFAASGARIARDVIEAGFNRRKPPFQDDSGNSGTERSFAH